MKGNIELGDRVKDKITGVSGIVIGMTDWLYGCKRATIQLEKTADGVPIEPVAADVPQLDLLKKGVISRPEIAKEEKVEKRPHGPRQDPSRRKDPRR